MIILQILGCTDKCTLVDLYINVTSDIIVKVHMASNHDLLLLNAVHCVCIYKIVFDDGRRVALMLNSITFVLGVVTVIWCAYQQIILQSS